MAKPVSLTIDGIPVQVPEGTVVVDAARKAGVDVPVFCYHPKMEPVGMCRMCLVEVGRPVVDRATGEVVLGEDGKPKIQFGAKLETACTTPVSEGMVVLGATEKAKAGRKDILEFLLTSHPLDCPICDKGGECPLQDLTMAWGPGQSRYLYDEKIHFDKHIPLGELIYLDRERCIQCGRCVRFQSEIVDDPVIGFFQRGRALEIVTYSEPGFDSFFSGNTTDICPVGALTTADFRFRARPWELKATASICNHCTVGCNIALNVRREAESGGDIVVKRVVPRQNEEVNEIWICDKGRFGHHYAAKRPERLMHPLVRKNGELQPATWEEALETVANRLGERGKQLVCLVGGRLSNEDMFNLLHLTKALGGTTTLYSQMAGGELTTQVGLAPGSSLADLGKGSAILVVACDMEEEAPIWWLRIKQAAERGAQLIVINPRNTKLDRFAKYSLRYPFGSASAAVLVLANTLSSKRLSLPEGVQELVRSKEVQEAGKVLAEAQDLVVFYGSEGIGIGESATLAQSCAALLESTSHVGRPNNGLIGVWPRANDQGAWELGLQPSADLHGALEEAQALYIAAADPVGDDPTFQAAFGGSKFVVVQDLVLTQTARLADVVLPVQSWLEREGSYTSGERRVQRYYPALQGAAPAAPLVQSPGINRAMLRTATNSVLEGPQPDFTIPAFIAERLGIQGIQGVSAALAFDCLAGQAAAFKGISYQRLSEVTEQWPIIGRSDLYYGGTSYDNSQGLGIQLPLARHAGEFSWPAADDFHPPKLGLTAFPITRLYDRGITLSPSKMLEHRTGEPYVIVSEADAGRLKIPPDTTVRVTVSEAGGGSGQSVVVRLCVDRTLPERVVLVPRSFGVPISNPVSVEIKPAN